MSDSVRSRGQVEGGGGAGVGDEEGRHVSSFSRMSRFHSVFPAQWYAALRCAAQCCAALRCAALRGACWTQRSHPLLRLTLIDKRTVPAGRRMNADVRARPAQARMFITTHLRLLVHRHAYCSDPLRSAPSPSPPLRSVPSLLGASVSEARACFELLEAYEGRQRDSAGVLQAGQPQALRTQNCDVIRTDECASELAGARSDP